LAWKDKTNARSVQALFKQNRLRPPANQDQPKDPLQIVELSGWPPALQAKFARASAAEILSGGDIFLDLFFSDACSLQPQIPTRQPVRTAAWCVRR
jgi:hypothetical protein